MGFLTSPECHRILPYFPGAWDLVSTGKRAGKISRGVPGEIWEKFRHPFPGTVPRKPKESYRFPYIPMLT